MSELIKRDDVKSLDGYYTYEVNGRKYSVVNFDITMKSMIDYLKKDNPKLGENFGKYLYKGWESIEMEESGALMGDTLERAATWEALKEILDHGI